MKKAYLILSWVSVLLLWACAASVYVSPAKVGGLVSVYGLTFPLWVALTGLLLAIGLVCRTKAAWVPVVGLLACAGSIRDYCPINVSSPHPKGCIKVISYNVFNFTLSKDDPSGELSAARYICTQRADIACLQETECNRVTRASLLATMKKYGYHYESQYVGSNLLALASRYPILKVEEICHSKTNGAAAWYVVPKRGDTIIVINAHLESMHLSPEEREGYRELVHNPEEVTDRHGKLHLVRKIAAAGVIRAQLTDSVAAYIDRHAGKRLILMGDFNDTPISYAHHKICTRLTDAYRATGNGIGRSFHKDAIYVRIDNIFASEHYKPFAAYVDQTVPFSDHYPIIAWLKPVK